MPVSILPTTNAKWYTWDLVSSTNKYKERIFPTFDDVSRNIKKIIDSSEYDDENKGAYKGALLTRLQSLSTGINRILFSTDEVSEDILFDKNVIVDLSRVSFGKELIHYLLTYGYLAYKYVELYGINSIQMGSSDMVDMTKYLHNYFPITAEYIALESIGDGDYILISPDDDVCKFMSESKEIKDLNLKLFDYILKRFKEADQYTK